MRELSKVGMFVSGIICGLWWAYILLNLNFDLPLYPNFIAIICLILIGLIFQEAEESG